MTVIIDANIIISALINPNGKEAVCIFDYADKIDFVAPDLIFREVQSKKTRSFQLLTLPYLLLNNRLN